MLLHSIHFRVLFTTLIAFVTLIPVVKTVTSAEYPGPPRNLRYNLTIIQSIKNGKISHKKYIIKLTLIWDPPENREDKVKLYDLHVFVPDDIDMNPRCSKDFRNYSKSVSKNNLTIPYEFKSTKPTTIHFGCVYSVQLRSYPYNSSVSKILEERIQIPECIQGICICKDPLHRIESLTVRSTNVSRRMHVSWFYPDNDDEIENFHVISSQKFSNEIILYRKVEVVNVTYTGPGFYEAEVNLSESNNENKISVNAFNTHLCNVNDSVLVGCDSYRICYCANYSLEKPTNITVWNSQPGFTVLSWQYWFGNTSKIFHHFIVFTKQNEYRVHVSKEILLNNLNQWLYFNTTIPCNSTSESVQIHAVDHKECFGPIAKQEFGCPEVIRMVSTTKYQSDITIPIVMGIAIIVAIAFAMFIYCYSSRIKRFIIRKFGSQKKSPQSIELIQNIIYMEKEIQDARDQGLADNFEISYSRLKIGKEIGKGAFGCVCIATADSIAGNPGKITVAVKQLKESAANLEKEDLLAEIRMMKQVGQHPNIITMIACCTLKQPYCMIMEYVSGGDLLHYLRRLRKEYVRKSQILTNSLSSNDSTKSNQLVPRPFSKMSTTSHNHYHDSSESLLRSQSSNSSTPTMVFSAGFTIREENEDEGNETANTVEQPLMNQVPAQTTSPSYVQLGSSGLISLNSERPDPASCCLNSEELYQFAFQIAKGMRHLTSKGITHRDLAARNVLIDENKTLKISDFGLSRTGIYFTQRGGRVPLRWLSIEAIRDNRYSMESDVWAYGVVLWEICTLGGFPYATVTDELLADYLLRGKRLEKPDNCAEELYSIMEACWNEDPNYRPHFYDICDLLDKMKDESHVYVHFDAISNRPLPPETLQVSRYQKRPK